ncbi:MAG TPA: hypothetical protein VE031_02520 [Chthoniobacterales bacterium]|nr:hypothetical protein [Chthoniobacterales bacterium]
MHDQDIRYRLTIPIEDAFRFAIDESDLGYRKASTMMRQVVGVLVIDALQYAEHWRIAADARALLADRWPDCPSFESKRTLH